MKVLQQAIDYILGMQEAIANHDGTPQVGQIFVFFKVGQIFFFSQVGQIFFFFKVGQIFLFLTLADLALLLPDTTQLLPS